MSAPNVQYLAYFGFTEGEIVPARIVIGPGTIWLGVTPPPSAFPLLSANVVPLDEDGKPSDRGSPYGAFAGMTEGPTVITYTPKIVESGSDIVDGPVHAFSNVLSLELSFAMKEIQYMTLLAALPTAFTNRSGSVVEGDPVDATRVVERFSFGGHAQDVPTSSVLVVVPKVGQFDAEVTDQPNYLTFMLYRAYNAGAVQMGIDKRKGMLLKVTFKGLADLSRVDGDLVGQLVNHTGLEP